MSLIDHFKIIIEKIPTAFSIIKFSEYIQPIYYCLIVEEQGNEHNNTGQVILVHNTNLLRLRLWHYYYCKSILVGI